MNQKILEGLDPAQKEAVFSDAPRLLVVAGPGSGKTRVLASRFARILANGASPDELLAVTFTNRAAEEMRSRVAGLLERAEGAGRATGSGPSVPGGGPGGHSMPGGRGRAPGAKIGTFHSLCLAFLKNVRTGFTLYNRDSQLALLKELGVNSPHKAADLISAIKNRTAGILKDEERKTFEAYQHAFEQRNCLDLDDLIPETIKALERAEPAWRADAGGSGHSVPGGHSMPAGPLAWPFGGLTHVMVDEFQDINAPQATLVRLLARGKVQLFAIGDPDQAIYSFRGSSLKSFMDFQSDYPGSVTIRLVNNYRSHERIVRAGAALIKNNVERMDSEVRAVRPGGRVSLVGCADERAEAGFVVREVEAGMGGLSSLTVGLTVGASNAGGARFSDFGVFYRTNRQAEALVEAFKKSSIPFHVVGPLGPGLKKFLDHLRTCVPDGALLSDLVKKEARAQGLDQELEEFLIHRAGGAGRAPGSGPSVPGGPSRPGGHSMPGGRETLDAFIDEMILSAPSDNYDVRADKVNLMTMHMSKGLEFEVVFITGAEDGLVPLGLKGRDTDTEEERRLFYVGITRARKTLYLLHAARRRVFGKPIEAARSPFLAEIPPDLMDIRFIKKKKKTIRPVQKRLFE